MLKNSCKIEKNSLKHYKKSSRRLKKVDLMKDTQAENLNHQTTNTDYEIKCENIISESDKS